MIKLNEKFKIIELGDEIFTSKGNLKDYLNKIPNNKFKRTKVTINDKNGKKNVENLSLRSSWTFDEDITVFNEEVLELKDFAYNNDLNFKLIKYEKNDFFKLHKDHKGSHTCLIIGGSEFKGGILSLKNDLFEIKINPEEMKNKFYMIIFSIDFYHEISPIIEGKRYVLKISLINKLTNHIPIKPCLKKNYENEIEDCYTDEDEYEEYDKNIKLSKNIFGDEYNGDY